MFQANEHIRFFSLLDKSLVHRDDLLAVEEAELELVKLTSNHRSLQNVVLIQVDLLFDGMTIHGY